MKESTILKGRKYGVTYRSQQYAVDIVDKVVERLYAVQPLGQTAGLKENGLSTGPISHPDGWQLEKRPSLWSGK
jgi:hypothetical protein